MDTPILPKRLVAVESLNPGDLKFSSRRQATAIAHENPFRPRLLDKLPPLQVQPDFLQTVPLDIEMAMNCLALT
jgi:hypothetical protein